MGWWRRVVDELAGEVRPPATEVRGLDVNSPSASLFARLFGAVTVAGEPVSAERAVGLSTVWGCVNLIAGTIAAMPLKLYRVMPSGREEYTEHPLYDVLTTRPNPVTSLHTFWESTVTSLLLHGNSYSTITRDDFGRPRALWFQHPRSVSVELETTGKLRYKISPSSGPSQTLEAAQVLHIVGPHSDNGYLGKSVIAAARETLGHAHALERHGQEFFVNAAVPKGILSMPGRLSPQGRENIKASLKDQQSAAGARHQTLVLEDGMTWTPIGINHEDSQFVETLRWSVEEICRLFLVPPHLVGADVKGSMVYSNAETVGLNFLKFTLSGWLSRIESAVNFALVSPLERHQMYAEYLPEALLALDTKTRYEAYQLGLAGGWLTVDEIRAKENLPALTERTPTLA